jgi:hypothetical protein
LSVLLVLAFSLCPGNFQARADQPAQVPSGDDHPNWFTMKTRDGFLFVSNYENSPFTVRVRGKDVQQGTLGEGDNALNVIAADGLILQFVTAGIPQFFKGDASKLTDEDILRKHRDWELAYIDKSMGEHVKTGMNLATDIDGKKMYLFWEYDMPHPAKGGVIRNLMLTARVKNNLMILNGMLMDLNDEKAMMAKMFQTIGTLTPAPAPITVKQAKVIALKD